MRKAITVEEAKQELAKIYGKDVGAVFGDFDRIKELNAVINGGGLDMSYKAFDRVEAVLPAGASLDRDATAKAGQYFIDAPEGMVWNANYCHVLCETWENGSQTWLNQATKDIIENIKMGVSDCDDDNCDECERG